MTQLFTKERINVCEELMRPEIRCLIDLPLDKKVEVSRSIIKEAVRKYPKVGIGFSGGGDSLVMLHIALQVCPKDIPILFSNTYQQFPETYKYIDEIMEEFGLTNFNEGKAEINRFEDFQREFKVKSPSESAEFTKTCCQYHKINPMIKLVSNLNLNALITGIRGVEHEERAQETLFSPRPTHIRIHPLLFWRSNDVLEYVKMHNLKSNPLYAQGYTSLGCTHCTFKNIDPNAHERAGRGEVRETIMKSLRDLGYS